MAKKTFAIMGATGNIGHYLVEELLHKGHKVRAIGRSSTKLKELKAKGAEVVSGDIKDSHFLSKAFKGCNAVFCLLPPGYDASDVEVLRDQIGDAVARAVEVAKISHVVNVSSVGADLKTGTGPIKALHRQEERLNAVEKLNVLHLRANFFMENLLMCLKNGKEVTGSLHADLAIPMVSTHDVAMKAAEFLDSLKFKGSSVFDFGGPKDVTMAEAVRIFGKVLGKANLKYKVVSYDQREKNLIASGMKHQLAKSFMDMEKAFNEKKIVPTQQMTGAHRGKMTLEEFAKSIALKQRKAA